MKVKHPLTLRKSFSNLWIWNLTCIYAYIIVKFGQLFVISWKVGIYFHGTLQRMRIANRGHLPLRTPGPVPFGTCICSNIETILSWTCHVYGPFEKRTLIGTSILIGKIIIFSKFSIFLIRLYDCSTYSVTLTARTSMFWQTMGVVLVGISDIVFHFEQHYDYIFNSY